MYVLRLLRYFESYKCYDSMQKWVYGAPNKRANWQTISTISAISPISAISAIQIFPLEAEPIYSEAIPTHVSNHLRAIQSYP